MARHDIHPSPRRLAVPVIVAAVVAAAAPGQTYDIVPIQAPSATPTSATDVNNLGQVVGCYTTGVGDIHAFTWTNGVFTDLGTLSESESAAYAINDAGLIVSEVFTGTAFADRHPFARHNGIMFELPTFRGAGIAFGVNNLGQIVGVIGPDITRWDNFIPVDLSDNPPGFGPLGAYGYSINSDGVIAGGAVDGFPFFNWTPARWTNGVGEHIGPPSTRPHEKYSINEAGFIVGRHPGFLSSARWNPGGGPLFLGIDFARDINNLNQVVGSDGGRAVMWESSVVTDLNDLLPPGSGWVLQRAEAINNVGQIVGEGLLNGVTRGFFMTRLVFQIVDPLLDPSRDPFDLDDPVVVANAQGREIVGLATDGVTRLVLRARGLLGSGTVTYELTDGAGGSVGVGGLRSVGGGEDVTTLTVPVHTLATGQHVGLAILIAPEDFVRDINDVPMTDRPVNVNVTYLPDGGTPVTATSSTPSIC
ncbi:MAG: hypothetical protein IH888_10960 [Planctomycetes bacterium]|nr:hypothetical protein [Planctomycetota bacterium]